MSKFEVGKKYKGWSRDCWTTPATLIVVAIAEDRKTLLAVRERGGDPKEAYTYKVRWDDRFGEKIVTGERGLYSVWRADKVVGDADIPEGWFSHDKRKKELAGQKAAKTRKEKALLKKLAESITPRKFVDIYLECSSFKNGFYRGDEHFGAERIANSVEVIKSDDFRKGRKGMHTLVSVKGEIPCQYIKDGIKFDSVRIGWRFWLYADKVETDVMNWKVLTGEEFKKYFN